MTKTIIAIVIIASIFSAVNSGVKKSEQNECVKWEAQSHEYTKWTSADWQKSQCKVYGIALK